MCLVDISHDLKETDALVFNLLKGMNRNFQIVFTKCDRMEEKDYVRGLEVAKKIQEQYQLMSFYVHFTSSRTLDGIDSLRNHIMFQSLSHQIS